MDYSDRNINDYFSIVVGLGSNIQPIKHLRLALDKIKKISHLTVEAIAPIYESDAQLFPDANPQWNKKYLNSAILIRWASSEFQSLLFELKKIETELGRLNTERWAPREIDLDILFIQDSDGQSVVLKSDFLIVPHPSLVDRPFALLPLLNLVPQPQLERPLWSFSWSSEKPFSTKKSFNEFWPEFVGILNVTDDSFSDGGKILTPEAFLLQAEKLIDEGATILDLGAESTRPLANEVQAADEIKQLIWGMDLLNQLDKLKLKNIKISIDSRKPKVVQNIIEKYPIDFINDVSGFSDQNMLSILSKNRIKSICMHSLTIPPNSKEVLNPLLNPIPQIKNWWNKKKLLFQEHDIFSDQIIFDPGIGFGKTAEQNSYILSHIQDFADFGCDVFLGYSRKSYLKQFSNNDPDQRYLETALQTMKVNWAFAKYLRVHNIEVQKIALRMIE